MPEQKYQGVSPVGRIISESIFAPKDTYKGRPVKPHYYIQVAFHKTDPGLQKLLQDCQNAAVAGFPGGESSRPDFAWKRKDGDVPPNNEREGWAGCMVFTFKTGFPVIVADEQDNRIIEPAQMKPGYQVAVAYSVNANGNAEKPGIYLNFTMVKRIAIDAVIVTGPSISEVFGTAIQANPLQPVAAPVAQVPPVYQDPGAQAQPDLLYRPDPRYQQQTPAAQVPPTAPAAQVPGVPAQPDLTFLTGGLPTVPQ